MMTINEIQNILPHRFPFLLIDKVIEIYEEKRITALKNVTQNEYFFQGHFPGKPVMPGVLIVESMAQAGAILILQKPENKGKIAFFTGISNLKFRKQVIPGDTLILKIEIKTFKRKMGKASGEAYVGENLVAKGDVSFIIQ
ncbi:MAG: 3-hydroxyacyl-ACP dehydratase FabZ [Clostridiales bacterium]|jgi:3-hydroxyacyl-[acyl-carrier-protein] dehydratase|nr:3-hydroxyacyl-ACP dehydratase FabZ [Clostridiales bacterium]